MHWTYEDLILPNLKARDRTEVIKSLGGLLHARGHVRDTFVDAVLEREDEFATGLPTPEIHVAIPHADIEHVIQPAIAIAVLANPVEFVEMGNPDSTVDVQLVCMLAVTESETLVSLLKSLVGIFQDPQLLHLITEQKSASNIAAIFNERLPFKQEA
jgi:PTS system galactitol-specific IIA component